MVAAAWATIHREEASPTPQKMSILGLDIARLVFHIVGMDHTGHVGLRNRMARSELLPFIVNWSPLRIGMEACGSAYYWSRAPWLRGSQPGNHRLHLSLRAISPTFQNRPPRGCRYWPCRRPVTFFYSFYAQWLCRSRRLPLGLGNGYRAHEKARGALHRGCITLTLRERWNRGTPVGSMHFRCGQNWT
jgi:hypothetical protein